MYYTRCIFIIRIPQVQNNQMGTIWKHWSYGSRRNWSKICQSRLQEYRRTCDNTGHSRRTQEPNHPDTLYLLTVYVHDNIESTKKSRIQADLRAKTDKPIITDSDFNPCLSGIGITDWIEEEEETWCGHPAKPLERRNIAKIHPKYRIHLPNLHLHMEERSTICWDRIIIHFQKMKLLSIFFDQTE